MKTKLSFILILSVFVANFAAGETDDKPPEDSSRETLLDSSLTGVPIQIHGFLSQGFMQTTKNNYFPNSTDGTFEFAEAGLNVNAQLMNNLRVGFQLFARDYGGDGDYSAKFDWFVLDYRWRDWLGVRVGRVKIPYGLYNETNDIDSARVPVFLPQSVYPNDQRNYLLAQTGVDLYGFIDMSSAGALDYNIYRGTLTIPPESTTLAPPLQLQSSEVPFVQGGRLIWETPVKNLRAAGSFQNLAYKSGIYIPALSKTVNLELKFSMAVASLEYTNRRFQLVAEYARWWGQVDSDQPTLIPPSGVTHERYYGMFSYNVNEWFHPGTYYSVTYPNSDLHTNSQDYTYDTALFCRVDLTKNWLFKVEWHYIQGTSELTSSLNDGTALNNLADHWQMFLAKTTVFF